MPTLTVLDGTSSDQILQSTADVLIARGEAGNDVLKANNSFSWLNGGSGDDTFIFKGGESTMIGGSGADTYFLRDDDGFAFIRADVSDVIKIDGSLGAVSVVGHDIFVGNYHLAHVQGQWDGDVIVA